MDNVEFEILTQEKKDISSFLEDLDDNNPMKDIIIDRINELELLLADYYND